jgi:peptidoglycan/LPS O-acetylase OafA/YrhL
MGNVAAEIFLAISGFLGTYKVIQIYKANGNKLGVKDVLKI